MPCEEDLCEEDFDLDSEIEKLKRKRKKKMHRAKD